MPDRFAIICWHCKRSFDGDDAPWCSCITKRPTLSCIHCLTCFCDAPPGYQVAVWGVAPDGFLQRHRAPRPLPDNPDAATVVRPLVLVVDDDRDVLAIAVNVIAALGYGVVYAGNGREALKAAALYRPDLVLTDALMPGLDGRELALQLKAKRRAPRVVVMSAVYRRPHQRTEASMHYGVDDFVRKPLTIRRLQRLLAAQLVAEVRKETASRGRNDETHE